MSESAPGNDGERAMSGSRSDDVKGDAVQSASEQSFPASDAPSWTSDEPDATSDRAEAAHEEYMAEVARMVDEETAKLFARLEAVVGQVTADAPGGRYAVSRQGRSFSARNGNRTISAEVEAITDLQNEAERAQAFPNYQARCRILVDGQSVDEWVLRRTGSEGNVRYLWMAPRSDTPITEADIAADLQALAAPAS
jgi:hypothetical protein